jgi:alkanesulfonate monooxygenase SsuD/methylene tetrahydromethanopterin reductase-like flavin-dependent oxidoreductase (luciferase family)
MRSENDVSRAMPRAPRASLMVSVGMAALTPDATPSTSSRAIAAAGVDHVVCGDHVSFIVGAGFDGLIGATHELATEPSLRAFVAVYLLPLRHPVLVARQLASVSERYPGRLTFGVGVGGEDPHELEICGIDPRTRGRRMDESLAVLRALLAGAPVTHHGEFFDLADALILPPPQPPIPIIVGGRSDAALRRAGRLADGWIGIWNSARRFEEATAIIDDAAASAGRQNVEWQHAMQVWCGIGSDPATGRAALAPTMESMYNIPYERFERYSPCGAPDTIAEFLAPYVSAGCRTFNLLACAEHLDTAVAGVSEIRRILNDITSPRS